MRPVAAAVIAAMLALLAPAGARAATPSTVTVGTTVLGPTPVLGYNIAHAMSGSNAADWWRYSGARAARVFLSASDIEPVDDLGPLGDGVTSRAGFDSRRAALRANAASTVQALDPQFVNWSSFATNYAAVATGNNRFSVAGWFPQLRAMGVDILVNITASPTRFPVAGPTDYPNLWELWQHYYAQAFSLSRDHGVVRFSMFNEPNGWSPAITVEGWALRLRVASDAVQAAVADMNTRYGRSVTATVFAPNTANGATKYDDHVGGDYWGEQAMTERTRNLWGEPAAGGWRNFQVYNYQKYTSSPADYGTDFGDLAGRIAADLPAGEPMPPLALTEFNVRTGANYDSRVETGDSPSDYASLGASSVMLAARGAAQLYLFKFGMTERSGGTYPVAKNGTHYVNNATTGLNNYGGAAGTAEVYRLFLEASAPGRDRLAVNSTLGATVAVQATRDAASGAVWVFLANTATTATDVDVDLSALGVADGSLAVTEEVSTTSRGGVVRIGTVSAGRVAAATMPAQSVWLISVSPGVIASGAVDAVADAVLGDGTGRTATGATIDPLLARADGSTAGRKVSVLRFPVPTTWSADQRVLLSLTASTTSGTTPVQAHLYGLDDDGWTEATASFASLTSALRQNVAAGNAIANNVVTGQGSTTRILGQLMANSTTSSEKLLDVTDFVKSQTDGHASFLLVQDHRWDVKLPQLTAGDTQPAGLRVVSREGASRPRLRIFSSGPAPIVVAAPTFSPAPGSYGGAQTVALASATPGASIRYTTNGATPTAGAGTLYTAPFTVSATTTVRAVAFLTGNIDSPVTSATFTLAAPTAVTAEFEGLAVVATSGDSWAVKTDSAASGGKSLLYRSNAVGDYVVVRLNVPVAGSYAVSMSAKMMGDRGRFQLAVADAVTGPWVDVDTPKDEYRASTTFGSVGAFAGRAVFTTGGTKYLRLTVTGRNPSSSDYNLNGDRIVLTP